MCAHIIGEPIKSTSFTVTRARRRPLDGEEHSWPILTLHFQECRRRSQAFKLLQSLLNEGQQDTKYTGLLRRMTQSAVSSRPKMLLLLFPNEIMKCNEIDTSSSQWSKCDRFLDNLFKYIQYNLLITFKAQSSMVN